MKIGILTLSASDNCGSLLQTYALQKVLVDKYGNEVEVINFRTKESDDIYSVFPKNPLLEKRRFLNALMHHRLLTHQKEAYEYFRKQYLNLTEKEYKTEEELNELNSKYDVVVCGSDQIWNVKMTDYNNAFFLGWYKGKNKLSYAASLGGYDVQEALNYDQICKWVNELKTISVREATGKRSIVLTTGKDVKVNADPTLLISSEEWRDLINNRKVNEDYIFYYSWAYNSKEINEIVAEFARIKKIPVYVINASKWNKFKPQQFGFKLCDEMGPLAFLNLMKYAKYALVQSYHGVIFAYQMRRDFWFLDNQPVEKMDNRLNYILRLLHAEDRVLRPGCNMENIVSTSFDYKNSELELLVNNSNIYLDEIGHMI